MKKNQNNVNHKNNNILIKTKMKLISMIDYIMKENLNN